MSVRVGLGPSTLLSKACATDSGSQQTELGLGIMDFRQKAAACSQVMVMVPGPLQLSRSLVILFH